MSDGSNPLSRRLMAEALGSSILVATVVGSGIMAEQLAGGNQAIALLGNTIPTGNLVVFITILARFRAHPNPAPRARHTARRRERSRSLYCGPCAGQLAPCSPT